MVFGELFSLWTHFFVNIVSFRFVISSSQVLVFQLIFLVPFLEINGSPTISEISNQPKFTSDYEYFTSCVASTSWCQDDVGRPKTLVLGKAIHRYTKNFAILHTFCEERWIWANLKYFWLVLAIHLGSLWWQKLHGWVYFLKPQGPFLFSLSYLR